MKRFNPQISVGLTKEQVQERIQEHLVNFNDEPKTKSIGQIIRNNVFTYFNFINMMLGLAVFIAGLLNGQMFNSLKNCLFMGVIIVNSIISIVEEIISKRIIDRLSFLSESKVTTIRNGQELFLEEEEIVLDDLIKVSPGHQIITDAIVMDQELEVNESLLTGEPDAILKKPGDLILSGSFVVSGSSILKVEHIGSDNYASKISREAKYEKQINSMIMTSFEKLLKVLSLLIIPIGIVMFFTQTKAMNGNYSEAIFTTVASLIGMIPEGLVLLTSSVMAVSVIRLSKYKVLVQQLYCIETLARVNVICLDKTGTLTEGTLAVHDYVPFTISKEEMQKILCTYANASSDNNATMQALKHTFNDNIHAHKDNEIPFSSFRKYSSITFQDKTYFIGAPEILLKDSVLLTEIKESEKNYRVLALVESYDKSLNYNKPIGYICLEDVIRSNAKETLDYFKKQGVIVKIISGDSATTVLNIANKVGLEKQKGRDLSTLNEEEVKKSALEYDIFGRVTPEEKKWLISSLQERGNTVAMMGDGVNDVLALKQSDCAISVRNGSDAARNVAQLVLLDNNFASLPQVVLEGRRTINNIERSASLLLEKTIYTILLIILSIITLSKYYFIPIQLTLITTFTIGTPSFVLALEPNNELVRGKFLTKIVSRSLPTALTVLFNVILVSMFTSVFHLSYELQSSLSVFLTTVTGLIYLYRICQPFTIVRALLFNAMTMGFIYCLFFHYSFFNLVPLSTLTILIGFVLSIDSLYIYQKINYIILLLFHKLDPTIKVEKSL